MAKRNNRSSAKSGGSKNSKGAGAKLLAGLLALVFIGTAVACGFGWSQVVKLKEQIKQLTPADSDKDLDNDNTEFDLAFAESENGGISLLHAKLPRIAYEANGLSESAQIAYTITAEITPATAENKLVDWSLVWEDDGSPVTSCVALNIPSDGSLTVTLVCTQAFPNRSMKLICTSRDSGVQGELLVIFEGKPSEISINNGSAVSVNWSKSATCSITLDNALGSVGEKFYNDLTVKSVTLHGTITHYDIAFLNSYNGDAMIQSGQISEYSGDTIYNFADKYPNALTASISGHNLSLSMMALPSVTWKNKSTGAPSIHNSSVYGTRYTDVTMAPQNVYAEVVVGTGNLTATVQVNFIAGVTAVNLGNNVVF